MSSVCAPDAEAAARCTVEVRGIARLLTWLCDRMLHDRELSTHPIETAAGLGFIGL